MPSDIAKKLSDPLHRIFSNGRFKESIEGVVVLKDVDPIVFAAFVQYALTNDYALSENRSVITDEVGKEKTTTASSERLVGQDAAAAAVEKQDESSESSDSSEEESQNDPTPSTTYAEMITTTYDPKSKKRKRSVQALPPVPKIGDKDPKSSDQLWRRFKKFSPKLNSLLLQSQHNKRRHQMITTTNSLIVHAAVVNFADQYLIPSLRKLALAKLHADLLDTFLDAIGCTRVFELLEYLYADLAVVEYCARHNVVREMVVLFCAAKIVVLARYEGFKRLLEENGELGADILYRKIINPEGRKLTLAV